MPRVIAPMLAVMLALVAPGRRAAADAAVEPNSLVLDASEGAVLVREVTVRGAEPPYSFAITPLGSAHGAAQLPGALTAATVTEPDHQGVRITVKLDGSDATTYDGSVTIRSAGQLVATVPVQVRVRHAAAWALLALGGSLLASFAFTRYRTRYLDRDRLRARVVRLRASAQVIPLPEAFRRALDERLTIAAAASRGERWKDAGAAVAQGEAMLAVFFAAPTDWRRQLDAAAELARRARALRELGEDRYREALIGALDDAIAAAPTLVSPAALRSVLEISRTQLRSYGGVLASLDALAGFGEPDTRAKVAAWEHRLGALGLGDAGQLATLADEVDAAVQAIELSADAGAPHPVLPPVESTPDLPRSTSWYPAYQTALTLIAMGLLAALGFDQLYLAKPTFGSIADYLALVAWGFGSEVSRGTADDLLKRAHRADPIQPV